MIVFPEMVDTGYSMPTIQEHATSWQEGAVPELQRMAKISRCSSFAGFRTAMAEKYTWPGRGGSERRRHREIPKDSSRDRGAVG